MRLTKSLTVTINNHNNNSNNNNDDKNGMKVSKCTWTRMVELGALLLKRPHFLHLHHRLLSFSPFLLLRPEAEDIFCTLQTWPCHIAVQEFVLPECWHLSEEKGMSMEKKTNDSITITISFLSNTCDDELMHGVRVTQRHQPSVFADWSSQDDSPRYELNGMNFGEHVHF